MRSLRTIALSSLIFCAAPAAHATIVFDNTGAGIFGSDPISADGPQANSFTTDGSGLIGTVTLLLDSGIAPNGDGVVEVTVYDDGGDFPNNPVAVLGDISDAELGSAPSPFTFANVGQALDPDTRYWIGLSDVTPNGLGMSSIEWSFAADASGTNVAGEFTGNGITGVVPNGDGTNGTGFPYIMCVTNGVSTCAVAPAPEPASLTLLGLGLAGIGLFRRRRRS